MDQPTGLLYASRPHSRFVTTEMIEEQAARLSSAIGRGVSQSIVDMTRSKLENVPRHPDYADHDEILFVYEKLDAESISAVRVVVEAWVEKEENVQRAARCVGRTIKNSGFALVQGFCALRFKAVRTPKWGPAPEGLAIRKGQSSTVVLIALEDLHRDNGFFTRLESGEDICIDGGDEILFPGTGGGLGIMFDLRV